MSAAITETEGAGQPEHGVLPAGMLEFDATATALLVRRALQRHGVGHDALDDAVQDVFVVLARRAHEFDRTRSLEGWLWGLARRVASTHRRSLRRRARLQRAFAAHEPAAVRTPEQQLALVRAAAFLDEFVAELGTIHRETFVLSELHGQTGPEIAERLGINLNTAYARIRAVRRRFDAALVERERVPALVWLAGLFTGKPAVLVVSLAIAWLGVLAGVRTPHRPVHARVGQIVAAPGAAAIATPSRDRDLPAKDADMTHAILTAWLLAPTLAVQPPSKPTPAAPRERTDDGDADAAARVGTTGQATHYIYDDEQLTGEVLAPDGKLILWRTSPKMESMLRIRPHFIRELVTLGRNV